MKTIAEKWEFKTILYMEFVCKNCDTSFNINYDVSYARHNIYKFTINCTKCNQIIEVEQ